MRSVVLALALWVWGTLFAADFHEGPLAEALRSHQTLLSEYGVFWGGDLYCGRSGCQLVAVAHERGRAVVLAVKDRAWRVVGELATAYHPDAAVWLDETRFVVAVESGSQLVLAEVAGNRIEEKQKLAVGFPPRAVVALPSVTATGEKDLLALPYSGRDMAYFPAEARGKWQAAVRLSGCQTPWHPAVRQRDDGAVEVVSACLDDRRVMLWQRGAQGMWSSQEVAHLPQVPRQVAFSRDGKRLYVALELGGKATVVDWQSPEKGLHWMPLPGWGAASVWELADGTVVWGEDRKLYLQRCNWTHWQCETRQLPIAGFAELIRSGDLDQDGHEDLVVFNSVGSGVDLWYGPLWEQATRVAEHDDNENKH